MNRKVIALVDDLFWRTKIDHAVKSAGVSTIFLSDPGELTHLDHSTTSVVIVDLALRRSPFDDIAAMKAGSSTATVPIVGYYEHVRNDLKQKAQQAGCDEILPRSAFSQRLAELLMRYTMPGAVKTESEEPELPEE